MPGAVFVGRGRPNDDDLECARCLQRVRADYKQDGHAPTLIQELTQFGFPDGEIAAAVLNPATITSCLYNFPIADWGLPKSRFANSDVTYHRAGCVQFAVGLFAFGGGGHLPPELPPN